MAKHSKISNEITRADVIIQAVNNYLAEVFFFLLPIHRKSFVLDHDFPRTFSKKYILLSHMRKGWALASLTSPIGGSAHDGCDPGKLAVGDAVNSLELFKVDGESFGEGVREAHRDGGSKHHCPAPATIRGHIAQVRGERRGHCDCRAWSTSRVPASCRAKQVLQNVHIVPEL